MATELKKGASSFKFVGRASINSSSFDEPKLNTKGNWLGLPNQNSAFAINVNRDGEDSTIYLGISGGRMAQSNVIRVFPRNRSQNTSGKTEFLEINFEERFDQTKIDQVSYNNIYTADINPEDGRKQFIDPIDFQAYLRDNLVNGQDVSVYGEVSYSSGKPWEENPRIYRNFNIKSVYSNAPREVTNKETNEKETIQDEETAQVTQAIIVTAESLSDDWKKELKNSGETIISVLVPERISKVQDSKNSYTIDYNKTVALPQALTYRGTEKVADVFFNIKDDETARLMTIYAQIKDGYEVSSEIEITPEMQLLIDEGLASEEDFSKDLKVRGPRKTELIFTRPVPQKDEEGNNYFADDKTYNRSHLVVPSPEQEEKVEFNPDTANVFQDNGEADIPFSDSDMDDIDSIFLS